MKKILLSILILLMISGCSSGKEAIYLGSDLEEHYTELEPLLDYISSDSKTQGYTVKKAFINGDNVNGEDVPYALKDVSNFYAKRLKSLSTKDVNYIFGSHDSAADTSGTNGFLYGGYDFGKYYVYAIDFYEMTEVDEAEDGIDTFEEWIETLTEKKPIIIFSHVPLHERRKDNVGASLWFDVINETAEDFDIIFTWGHNHTNESNLDDNLDFLAPGNDLKIEGIDDEQEINFYYIKSGFILKGVSVILIFNDDDTITYRPVYLEKDGFDENIVEKIELSHK